MIDGTVPGPKNRDGLAWVAIRSELSFMKTSVFVGVSVDGFLARADGTFDFLSVNPEEEHGYEAFMASVDGLLIGRNTYDVVLPFPAWPYGNKPVFVLSTRSLAPPPAGAVVERMSGAPAEVLEGTG
jgi:dihydrofolate reductase